MKKNRVSMRWKIQKSMMVILAVTLVLSYAILSVILYNRNLALLQAELQQEAKYIRTAINISGTEYLEQMDLVEVQTRVTQIGIDGSVLYDSRREDSLETTQENHASRQEVKDALAKGNGEALRRSATTGEEMYYYALLLDDGSVLRVSKVTDSLISTAMTLFPVMGILAAVMVLFALLLARWQTARLIKPINTLDLEQPLENEVYEELDPLLVAIDKENKEKEAVSNMRK